MIFKAGLTRSLSTCVSILLPALGKPSQPFDSPGIQVGLALVGRGVLQVLEEMFHLSGVRQ